MDYTATAPTTHVAAVAALKDKHATLRTVDGREYVGLVTDTVSGPEGTGDWVRIDGQWWVRIEHVCAAVWGRA